MIIKYSTGKPPNNIYGKCKKQFGVNWDYNLIITYGDTVYCKNEIPEDLKVHEATHVKQQSEIGKDIWWEKYLVDSSFRLEQEVEAYKNQIKFINKNYDRNKRKLMMEHIIKSMVSMYGNMCTEKEAINLLK